MLSRNYRRKRNGNLKKIFSYAFNGKKFIELFASTLNGPAASVRCVSSAIVVLNTKLTGLIAAHAHKKESEKQNGLTKVQLFAS